MHSVKHYQFHDYLLLRTPAYSHSQYAETSVQALLKDEYFLDALSHASESLVEAIRKADFNADNLSEKVTHSILKYFNRMCYRATPFGTMAGLSTAYWKEDERGVLLGDREKMILPNFSHTIQQGLQILTSGDKDTLVYEINPSLYGRGTQLRYIKYRADEKEKKRVFNIESVEMTEVLQKLFAFISPTTTHKKLASFLMERFSVDASAAQNFIGSLSDAQVIRSLQEPNITGENYIQRMTEFRGRQMPPPAIDDRSTYINMRRATKYAALPATLKNSIIDGLYAIEILNAQGQNDLQSSFKKKFRQKFEAQSVPLLDALDPELGIDYYSLASGSEVGALLEGVTIQSPVEDRTPVDWTSTHRMLLNKWHALENNTIVLTDEDLDELKTSDTAYAYPNSMSVLFRVKDDLLFIENAGNASANALIGRFTLLDERCCQAAKEIAGLEASSNPDVIFAEIAHFSHLHAANIEQRSCLYAYEIPIVCGTMYDQAHRLALSDLMLTLQGNEFILTSKQLGKRVIPRMSSALNYTKSDLSVFRFLCDLQHQSLQTNFNFNPALLFPGQAFYPRVQYKDTVLHLATWTMKFTKDETAGSVLQIAKSKNWSRFISINQHDHQLVFDLESEKDIAFLASFCKAGKTITVKEFPFAAEQSSIVIDSYGSPYIHQFVASLVHREEVYKPVLEQPTAHHGIERKFLPGSQWLYLKIYCLPARSNEILTHCIAPAIQYLEENECSSQYFFVRYGDPDYHLRVRIRLVQDFHIGSAIRTLHAYLKPLFEQGLITNYCFDVYERELERYHPQIIREAENFFCASSALVLGFLQQEAQDDNDVQYFRIAFAGAELLLDQMVPVPEERVELFKTLFFSFSSEFNLTAALKQALSDKYRDLTVDGAFGHLLSFDNESPLYDAIQQYNDSLKLLHQASNLYHLAGKTQLIIDVMHMHLNRCFVDHPRKQEMVFYYCMNRYYMSVCARQSKLSKSAAPVSQ